MDHIINSYRLRKIGNKYFITTDHGSYTFLNEENLKELKSGNLSQKLSEELERKEILLNQSNILEAQRDLNKRNAFLMHGTSLHIIVPTLRCDMKCVYCHASSVEKDQKGFDMSMETAEKTVDFILQSPSPKIVIEFQGGEPLLKWDLVKHIVEYAKKNNPGKEIVFIIVTNLNNMDEEKMQYLIKNDIKVGTSLDGPKKLHDLNRPYSKSSNYENVVYWIKKFRKELDNKGMDKMNINALVTLTRKSLESPTEIIDEFISLGLESIHLRFLNNIGVASKSWGNISYTSEEYLDFWQKCVDHIEKKRDEGIKIEERMVSIMMAKIMSKHDPGYLDLRSPCGAVIGQMVYNYDGKIYSCDEGRMIGEDLFMVGDVNKDDYKTVVSSDTACSIISSSINDQYICNTCAYKPYCGVCPVCNYAEKGNIVTNISSTDRCKVFKSQFDWVVENKVLPLFKDFD